MKQYEIVTGNERLFVRALHNRCFEAMRTKEVIYRKDIMRLVCEVRDDISKGVVNPAIHWITHVRFENNLYDEQAANEYYNGKKAAPNDIAMGLAVEREAIERNIIESVKKNTITVLKASSGQGKTTLAYRAAYKLQNEYCIYKIEVCENKAEIQNYIEYFQARIRMGEQILILIDNLDTSMRCWNFLVKQMDEQIRINYRVIVTSREDDWFLYAGDQSALRNIYVVQIELGAKEAENIYHRDRKSVV